MALWILSEQVWVVMERSEYFSELERLMVPSKRLLLGVDVMIDRSEVFDEEKFSEFERMRLCNPDM